MVYIRANDGDCYDASPNAGVEQWLSEDGYRITFRVGDYEFILRRNVGMAVEKPEYFDHWEAEDVLVTVRKA